MLWQWLFAECLGMRVAPVTTALLVAGSWSVYVLDRLLDSRKPGVVTSPGLRHPFYFRHQKIFWVLLVTVGGVSLPAALWWLPRRVLTGGLLLSALVAVYLAIVHGVLVRRGGRRSWFPKEYAVGALFAAGVTLPFWARMMEARPLELGAFALFALTCQLNTVAIEFWESSGIGALTAPQPTLWLGRHLENAAGGLFLVASACSVGFRHAAISPIFLYLAASALMMWAIARYRSVLGVTKSCTLMDAALVTPAFAVIGMLGARLIQ